MGSAKIESLCHADDRHSSTVVHQEAYAEYHSMTTECSCGKYKNNVEKPWQKNSAALRNFSAAEYLCLKFLVTRGEVGIRI